MLFRCVLVLFVCVVFACFRWESVVFVFLFSFVRCVYLCVLAVMFYFVAFYLF